ncbi:MAG TPA: TadE/TadG family type IV pilus assembly protein [Rhizobiaceae bacterium]|nr:TadE/TadG family type IV pilus assembly protein [Rhizobiaceae bacterium]
MIRNFFRDSRGNFAMMTVVAMVPIMGALAVAVDFAQMSKQRQETLNALDAAGMATARRITDSKTESEAEKAKVVQYARDFFEANLRSVRPQNAALKVVFPQDNFGGGTLRLEANLKYQPVFFPVFAELMGKESEELKFVAASEIRLKNTLEVALVLDNSGSMDFYGPGSNKKRLTVLKDAVTLLIDSLSAQALVMKQINKPVQFAVVPFAASVNVGPANKNAAWMDTKGLSPIHYENFTWTDAVKTSPAAEVRKFKTVSGRPYKDGIGWGAENNTLVTRFTLYDALKRKIGSTTTQLGSWDGCVEARPAPYNTNDAVPSEATPATLFVPMFAPDGGGNKWTNQKYDYDGRTDNDWWDDLLTTTESESWYMNTTQQPLLQKRINKYFSNATISGFTLPAGKDGGPNFSCTTKAITPLTDIVAPGGLETIKEAIDSMIAEGNTNVPEGMAWGWRTVSHGAPFTEGRPETEQNNDKVVIVLTDGANTYGAPPSSDYPRNRSTYAAFGFAGVPYKETASSTNTVPRIFLDTTVNKTSYTTSNYTTAMNQHFKKLCDTAKTEGVIVITVSLDLSSKDNTEKKQIEALRDCASESRFTKDPDDPTGKKMKKLYYEATSKDLVEQFRDITNELSNLRIAA